MPSVKAHSIMAVEGDGPVVESFHPGQSKTIEEVRRTLRLHMGLK